MEVIDAMIVIVALALFASTLMTTVYVIQTAQTIKESSIIIGATLYGIGATVDGTPVSQPLIVNYASFPVKSSIGLLLPNKPMPTPGPIDTPYGKYEPGLVDIQTGFTGGFWLSPNGTFNPITLVQDDLSLRLPNQSSIAYIPYTPIPVLAARSLNSYLIPVKYEFVYAPPRLVGDATLSTSMASATLKVTSTGVRVSITPNSDLVDVCAGYAYVFSPVFPLEVYVNETKYDLDAGGLQEVVVSYVGAPDGEEILRRAMTYASLSDYNIYQPSNLVTIFHGYCKRAINEPYTVNAVITPLHVGVGVSPRALDILEYGLRLAAIMEPISTSG